MPTSVTKYCLQELTDYTDFESLCHDLMVLEGYPQIEPLGGFRDKGRDAVHSDSSGTSTIFAYSVREDWRAKLAEDAAKIRRHNHDCHEMVFLCTTDFTANERDEAVKSTFEEYGWTLKLFGLERLRMLLDSKHPHIKQNHPAIFPPAFLKSTANALPAGGKHHLLIISAHADLVLAEWLARKLTADGYAVWYESIKSIGDDRYPEDISKAIKTETFRAITVYSRSFFESMEAIGLRALALDVGKDAEIDFIIPLSADPSEQINTASKDGIVPIQFGRNWAKGLRDLKETLSVLNCPKPRFDGRTVSSSYYDEAEIVSTDKETLYSNAFPIESIPSIVHRFQVASSFLEKEYENCWAFRKVSDGLVLSFFPPPEDVMKREAIQNTGGYSWQDFSEITWSDKGEAKKIYVNSLIPELIRKSVIVHCHKKGLKYCSDNDFMYFPDGLVPRNRLSTQLPDGTKLAPLGICGERKYYRPDDKSTYYRYFLAPTFFVDSKLYREPGVDGRNDFKSTVLYIRLRNRFTDTDNNVLPPRAALSRRKHLCKSWWNDDWFRRTLAVAQFLADEDGKIRIGMHLNKQIIINSFPNTFEISAGINEKALNKLGFGREESLLDPTELDESDEF